MTARNELSRRSVRDARLSAALFADSPFTRASVLLNSTTSTSRTTNVSTPTDGQAYAHRARLGHAIDCVSMPAPQAATWKCGARGPFLASDLGHNLDPDSNAAINLDSGSSSALTCVIDSTVD
ncbi:hypothetical protein EVAR_89672_1 [Eumeta japonica]|uniref:Uncharacterized protein n=1 Tax=Eumeta variegata TaxID=151549 RepID=A0A4C1Y9B5_EUMVA|nr:hypothetical protein EVAR_89672_1 [Eumeta japonica]